MGTLGKLEVWSCLLKIIYLGVLPWWHTHSGALPNTDKCIKYEEEGIPYQGVVGGNLFVTCTFESPWANRFGGSPFGWYMHLSKEEDISHG